MLNKKINLLLIVMLAFSIVGVASALDKDKIKVKNFTLKDYNNKNVSLTDFKESNAVVVMFVSTRCPVSNAYNSRMVNLHEHYSEKGVTFLAINSNKQENISEIKKHAMENDFRFHVLKDFENKLADTFEASVTPEVYVLNSSNHVLYHGRIDDSRRVNDVESFDLKLALNEILAGKKVNNEKTKAFGCSIKRVAK
jgi:peroxiredoxin